MRRPSGLIRARAALGSNKRPRQASCDRSVLAGQCGTSEAWCRTRKALAYRLCLSTPSGSGRPLKLGAAPLMYSMSAWCGEALARSAGRRARCARLQARAPSNSRAVTELVTGFSARSKVCHFWQKNRCIASQKVICGRPALPPTSAAGCNVSRCCFSRHSSRRGACTRSVAATDDPISTLRCP